MTEQDILGAVLGFGSLAVLALIFAALFFLPGDDDRK